MLTKTDVPAPEIMRDDQIKHLINTGAKKCFTKHKLHGRPVKGSKNAIFVHSDLDLWFWLSNSSERGTKHVFPVNLVQIRSAVPEIFYAQTKEVTVSTKKQNLMQFTACGN